MKLDHDTIDFIAGELEAQHTLQKKKVLDLARRLKPNLTPEDIRNPHDFPELEDPDWHFEDGQLSAIEAILVRLRALKNEAR